MREGMVEIRAAVNGDAEAIAAVLFEAFREYRALYTEGGFAATALQAHQVRRRMEEGPVWVAELGGTVVGTAAAVAKGIDLYIRGMAVLPSARGHHVGERLLEKIEALARQKRSHRLVLSTTPFLDRAIHLYEKFGFRRTEEGANDLFGTPLFTMERVVAR